MSKFPDVYGKALRDAPRAISRQFPDVYGSPGFWMQNFCVQGTFCCCKLISLHYSLGLLLLGLEVSEMHNIVVSEIHNIEVSGNIRVTTFFVVSKIYLVGVRQRSLEVSNLACKG